MNFSVQASKLTGPTGSLLLFLFISTSQLHTASRLSIGGSIFKIPLRSIYRRLRFSAIGRRVNWKLVFDILQKLAATIFIIIQEMSAQSEEMVSLPRILRRQR